MNRKADAGMIFIWIILIIVGISVIMNVNFGECRKDSDCGKNNYCGSDNNCHEHPVIEKPVFKEGLVVPAIIIGLSLIIVALILRGGPNPEWFKKNEKENHTHNHNDDEKGNKKKKNIP